MVASAIQNRVAKGGSFLNGVARGGSFLSLPQLWRLFVLGSNALTQVISTQGREWSPHTHKSFTVCTGKHKKNQTYCDLDI